MALNYIWIAFFLIPFVIGVVRLLFFQDTLFFSNLVTEMFDMSETGFKIALNLTGMLTLMLGLLSIGERGGVIQLLSRAVSPFFRRLFPEIPKDHPVVGNLMMNFSANMLGLDNAATPMGLKAINQLQELNPDKDTASNAQIMFLVLNTSGLTLIPIGVMAIISGYPGGNPTAVFIPILLATFFSTLIGLIAVAIYQKINLFDRVILLYLGSIAVIVAAFVWYISTLSSEQVAIVSSLISNLLIFGIFIVFIVAAFLKKVNVFDAFIDGAKEGFNVAIRIIPYLVGILAAIAVFRASGALDMITDGIAFLVTAVGLNADFVPALPTALMKPLSGSGARGMMVATIEEYGVNHFVSLIASTVQGATDTTFYIIALYFGSVGIRKTRYAITCGLIADLAGIIAAILIGYLFFH